MALALALPLATAFGSPVDRVLPPEPPSDTVAPVIVASDPADGSAGIHPDRTTLSITFSEPMTGPASYTVDDAWGTSWHRWENGRRTLVITRKEGAPLPAGAGVALELNPQGAESLRDRAGNALETSTLTFKVGGRSTPTILWTDPEDGALAVDPGIGLVSIKFSEEMQELAGYSIGGYWGQPAGQYWSADHTTFYVARNTSGGPMPEGSVVTFTLHGAPSGFRDLDSNFIEPFSFSFTLAESTPPTVEWTTPIDGTTRVRADLETVTIHFDEPMAPATDIVTDFPGHTETWSADQTTLLLTRTDTSVPLDRGYTYSFSLVGHESSGFHDVSGNALVNHSFDFTVVEDNDPAPMVLQTDPPNGSVGVSPDIGTVTIRFSEPMNTAFISYNWSPEFGSHSHSWSPDQTTLYLTRDGGLPSIPGDTVIFFRLNPQGSSGIFQDPGGNQLPAYAFAFRIEADHPAPFVVATSPANGEGNVDPRLQEVTVSFSEPMWPGTTNFSYSGDNQWAGEGIEWTDDWKTVHFKRIPSPPPLVGDSVFTITLGPGGFSPYEDLDEGNAMGPYSFAFTIAPSGDVTAPQVLSTVPLNGATGVSADTASIEIQFNEPMAANVSFASQPNWWPNPAWSWSPDATTLTITRDNPGTPLNASVPAWFVLNPVGAENMRDPGGNSLPTYLLVFIVEGPVKVVRVDAHPATGFDWPYYLAIPPFYAERPVLLVEPNNTGFLHDNPAVHEFSALNLLEWRRGLSDPLGIPLLVPTFPRTASQPGIYTHALDRYSLLTTEPGLERIDLQLIAMIEDAKQRLGAKSVTVDDKVFMHGFSASGSFTNRFTLIHPDMVKAAAPGSPGGWPVVPVSEWDGVPLKWAVGIQDLETLTGAPFDLATYADVPQYVYVGDVDDNDALDIRGIPQNEVDQITTLLGEPHTYIAERWPLAREIFDSIPTAAQLAVYPGAAHYISSEMGNDLFAFFQRMLARRPGDLIVDFGTGTGLYAYFDGGAWSKLSSLSAGAMTAGDLDGDGLEELIADLGAGQGIQSYTPGGGWAPLHAASPELLATGDIDGNGVDDLIVDFGSGGGLGIYIYYNGSTWQRLHALSPEAILTGDLDANGMDDLVVDFGPGPGRGIYIWNNNSSWSRLHATSPEDLIIGDLDGNGSDELIVDFGTGGGLGIYIWWNNTSWTRLHALSPEAMTTGDLDNTGRDELIVDFGPGSGHGIYVYWNAASWTRLHASSPETMVTGDLDDNGLYDLVVDFGAGPGLGLYAYYNKARWSRLHATSPEQLATAELGSALKSAGSAARPEPARSGHTPASEPTRFGRGAAQRSVGPVQGPARHH